MLRRGNHFAQTDPNFDLVAIGIVIVLDEPSEVLGMKDGRVSEKVDGAIAALCVLDLSNPVGVGMIASSDIGQLNDLCYGR